MRFVLFSLLFFSLCVLQPLSATELLKNGDFETGDSAGWKYWETFPWDGDGAPVESPTHVVIAIPGTIGNPIPPTTSGFFALTQQVGFNGTARGGLYQEVKVIVNTPYILTGHMAFYGDDIGDIAIIGILDGAWNPTLAFATINKNYIGGNAVSPWVDISLMVVPSKDIVTVFTETRQDWMHGHTAGWYDNLSFKPVPEPTKLFSLPNPKGLPEHKEKQKQADKKNGTHH